MVFEFWLVMLYLTMAVLNSSCSCQELVAEMVHTKEGSRAVREFLAYGSAKVNLIATIIIPMGVILIVYPYVL